MWRDPLDELIEDLEHALPPSVNNAPDSNTPALEDIQFVVCSTLFGSAEEQARLENDPRYERVIAYCERVGRRSQNGNT